MAEANLILASKSPRRAELLKQIGLQFVVRSSDIDEVAFSGESADKFVERMAFEKARACEASPQTIVLAADTIVELDGAILGKPSDRAAGISMLQRLSGRSHRVLTGVVVVKGEARSQCVVKTSVRFREIDQGEAARYWDSGEPKDKAGGYGIQGLGGVFVAELTGSYSNVMGLPIFETAQLLVANGIRVL